MSSTASHFWLTLVRHGQTVANHTKTIQGQSDTKLSQLGIRQSQQLSQHMDCGQYDLIVSSDLSRALDTAKIVVKSGDRIQTDVRLRERSFGIIEGQSLDQLKAAAAANGFDAKRLTQFTPEGGESLQQVNDRIVDYLNNGLLPKVANGSHVLLVSHGGVIREIMKYFKNGLKCQFNGLNPNIITPNTSVNEFKLFFLNNKLISVECLKIHDIQHLSGDCKTGAVNEDQLNDSNNAGQQEAL